MAIQIVDLATIHRTWLEITYRHYELRVTNGKSRIYIFGDLHPRVRNEDHCVRFYTPSWCLSTEHMESSRFYNCSHRCRQHSSVQSHEGRFRCEGSESLSCPETTEVGLWCPKSSSGAQLHPQSDDSPPAYRTARHLRHHHLRHHRIGALLGEDA
ncbi:uncharacterized protein TNCV_3173191 [Trichonephila clavipes]|nr:uncharacterized protein TNCV_3173191 [Trichonephila clavipes]